MKRGNSLDVIIPTLGRPEMAARVAESLLGQTLRPNSVIVVDQTPGAAGPENRLRHEFDVSGVCLDYLRVSERGLCAARNRAICTATGDICLFLDDDVIVPIDLIARHVAILSADSSLDALGGQVWHRRANTPEPAVTIEDPSFGTVAAFASDRAVERGPLFGGHFAVRRECAISIGGWDEAFVGPANWEEGDLMHRLEAAGRRFMWSPHPWLIHLRHPAGGCRIPGNTLHEEWMNSSNFFLYKFRYPSEKSWGEVMRHALRAGPLRRECFHRPGVFFKACLGLMRGFMEGRQRAGAPKLNLLTMLEGRDAGPGALREDLAPRAHCEC